jgi:gamma-glutamyltranspeptidase/glutathione hydrolase
MSDLQAHRSEWVEPIEATYRGHEVVELPPNGQGLVVLIALRILDAFSLVDMAPVERAHVMIEAIKLAFADGRAVIGDPESAADVLPLLEDDHIAERIARIGPRALLEVPPGPAAAGDTAYVAVVDRQGRAVSLIHSLFHHFGSHVVVPGTGITLQNRGSLFSSDARHPSALGPSRRPYHTIIPAMVMRGGRPFVVLGVVGGFQQPQAQVQILTSLVDLDLEIQAAVDAPRFRWLDGARVRLERGTPPEVADGLRARGHVVADDPALGFGGAQAIVIDPATGIRTGATDPRKDGEVGRT